jgi:hypothetical protein
LFTQQISNNGRQILVYFDTQFFHSYATKGIRNSCRITSAA